MRQRILAVLALVLLLGAFTLPVHGQTYATQITAAIAALKSGTNTWTGSNTFTGGVSLSTGPVGINLSGTTPPTMLTVGDTTSTSPRGITSWQSSSDTVGARLGFRKSRGTFATPTVITSGDMLGRMNAWGYDGANFLEMGSIQIQSVGTVGLTRVPTTMSFWTATDAAPSVLTLALTINEKQQVLVTDGTAAAPSVAFGSHPTTGVYLTGSGYPTVSVGGTAILQIGSTGSTYSLVLGGDAVIAEDGANVLAMKNAANAQEFRVYGTTTGPKYLSLKHDGTNAIVYAQSGALSLKGTLSSGLILDTLVAPSASGTRFLCIDTAGKVTSSASACSGS